jgi:hypothetical protein
MKTTFKYTRDKRTRRLTWIISLVVGALLGFFALYSRSGYFPIWFGLFALTLITLMVLSIPRRIVVTDKTFEIRCVVELTSIALEDVASIRKMEPGGMKFSFPVLGGYGFFGYYGYYYNFSELSFFKVYASQWNDFVRIEDIYEDIYVVNCADADGLIEAVRTLRRQRMIALAAAEGQDPDADTES